MTTLGKIIDNPLGWQSVLIYGVNIFWVMCEVEATANSFDQWSNDVQQQGV